MTSNLNQCLKKPFPSFKMKLGGFPPVTFPSPLEKENAWWQVVGEGTVSLRVAVLAPQVKKKRGNTRYWSPWPYEVTIIPSPLFHLAGGGYGYTYTREQSRHTVTETSNPCNAIGHWANSRLYVRSLVVISRRLSSYHLSSPQILKQPCWIGWKAERNPR